MTTKHDNTDGILARAAAQGFTGDGPGRTPEGAKRRPLRLTTGDLWDVERERPWLEQPQRNMSERVSPLRAIRMKCGSCMGGENDRLPLGGVAQEVDECASSLCPLWPFRFGHDPWRPGPSEAQREGGRRNAANLRSAPGNGPGGERKE